MFNDPSTLMIIAIVLGTLSVPSFIWGMMSYRYEGVGIILGIAFIVAGFGFMIASTETEGAIYREACHAQSGMPIYDATQGRLCINTDHLITIDTGGR